MLRVQPCCSHICDKILWGLFPRAIQGIYLLLCCVTCRWGCYGYAWSSMKKELFWGGLLWRAQWGRGQSPSLVLKSSPVSGCTKSPVVFVSAPAPGAAERRPAAVHPLSPACIRHPGCAGTDPDACHQCSTGMCPRDVGLS